MTDLVALGVQQPNINTVGNYLGAQKAATDQGSAKIDQAGARQQQEAASLEQIAQMGLGVMGGKPDGEIDPHHFDEMIGLLGDNPLAAKLKENPDLLKTITNGSIKVLQYSQDAQKFELAKKQFELELQKAEADAAKSPYVEMAPGATLHDPTGKSPDYTAPVAEKAATGTLAEYQTYVDQQKAAGREPLGILDYQQALKGNGVTIGPDGTVTVGGPAGKAPLAYDVEDAKARVKQSADIITAANSARDQVAKLGKMRDLLSNDKVYTGIGADQVQQLQRAAVAFGVADPSSVKDTESFNALTKAAVLDKMGGSLGTGVSNADRDYIDGQVPSLQNTKEGNLQLIDITEKLAKRQIDIAKQMNEFKKAHDGRLTYEWDQTLADWAEANPLFPEAKADMPKAGAMDSPGAGPVRVTSDADYNKLKSGTEFLAPDGTIRTKP